MIDKEELRKYLINNPSEVEKVLSYLGFHDFNNIQSGWLRCALPNRENKTSVAINMNNLYSNIFPHPSYKGDFYGMLMHWQKHFGPGYKWDFRSVLRVIKKIIALDDDEIVRRNEESSYYVDEDKERYDSKEPQSNKEYELSILDSYVKAPHEDFFKEGIMPQTQVKYSICFSLEDNRIIIPHFKYNDKSKIVGLQGRTTVENYEKFSVPKYTNLIKGFRKSKNLYGLSHNIKDIKEKRQLVIFESEKSVMKLDTMTRLKSFGVALGGSSLSDFQANLIGRLSKRLEGLEVIVALDKDVSKEVVLDMCNKLQRNGCEIVSYIEDKLGLLDEKDSPVDKGVKAFWDLYSYRVKWS